MNYVLLKMSTFPVVSHVVNAKASPEWRLNPSFGTKKTCAFPLNRGVPSIEVTGTKTMWMFIRDQIVVSPEWRCPLKRGVPKERFRCKLCKGGCAERSLKWLDYNKQFIHRIHRVCWTWLDCNSQWRISMCLKSGSKSLLPPFKGILAVIVARV